MGDYLTKDRILFERNHEGKLLPIDVIVEFLDDKPKIKAIPIMKGELAEYLNKIKENANSVESEIFHRHLVQPSLTLEEAKQMKYDKGYSDAILIALISISTGQSQKEIKLKFETTQKTGSDASGFSTTPQNLD